MPGQGPNSVLDKSYIADGAILQYAVVVFGDEDSHCKLPASSKANQICGVAQNASTASGDSINVRKEGISKVICAEAIPKGTEVSIWDLNGQVYDQVVFASGDGIVGIMEHASNASGDVAVCWLRIRTLLGD